MLWSQWLEVLGAMLWWSMEAEDYLEGLYQHRVHGIVASASGIQQSEALSVVCPPSTINVLPTVALALQSGHRLTAEQLSSLEATFEKVAIVLANGGGSAAAMDADIHAVGEYYLSKQPKLHASKEAVAKLTNVAVDKIESSVNRVANCMLHFERIDRRGLEEALLHLDADPLLYIDLSKFDETPMKVKTKEALTQMLPQPSGLDSSGVLASGGTLPHALMKSDVVGRAAVPSKLLASEQRYAMLLKAEVAHFKQGAQNTWHLLALHLHGCKFYSPSLLQL
eukprot:725702-Amphidinium_carterae.2